MKYEIIKFLKYFLIGSTIGLWIGGNIVVIIFIANYSVLAAILITGAFLGGSVAALGYWSDNY